MSNDGKFLAALLIVLFFGFLYLLFGVRYDTTRAGSHTGYVTAIEQRGLIFHNYAVYFKTDNSSSQEDEYCLHETQQNIAEKLKEYSKSRQLITVNYDGVRGVGVSLCQGVQIVSANED